MQTVSGLYRAFVEGMLYWRIAARHENDPVEMARQINAVINRTKDLTPADPIAVGGERRIEEVAGRAA